MFARCHRSIKKNSEPSHSLQLIIVTDNKTVSDEPQSVDRALVKKLQEGANYNKFIIYRSSQG